MRDRFSRFFLLISFLPLLVKLTLCSKYIRSELINQQPCRSQLSTGQRKKTMVGLKLNVKTIFDTLPWQRLRCGRPLTAKGVPSWFAASSVVNIGSPCENAGVVNTGPQGNSLTIN